MLLQDFYSVQNSEKVGNLVRTTLKLNKDHEVYTGHFPGRPVTPGVILMQVFKEEIERILGLKLRLVRATNIKFMAVVDPNTDEELVLESETEDSEDYIKIKGIAKHNNTISLKINALYEVLK